MGHVWRFPGLDWQQPAHTYVNPITRDVIISFVIRPEKKRGSKSTPLFSRQFLNPTSV